MVSKKKQLPLKKNKNNSKKTFKVKKLKNGTSKKAEVVAKLSKLASVVEDLQPGYSENLEVKKAVSQKKKEKYQMPSKAVSEELINSCLKALLNVIVSDEKQKNALFDDEKPIFAEVHCIKIQNTRGNIKL